MKLSNERLINSITVLQRLVTEKLPISVSFKISKNTTKINDILKIYDNERVKINTEYAKKDSEGNPINNEGCFEIDEQFKEKRESEMLELLALENEIDIDEIEISKLENIDFYISANELMVIDYMFKE